MFEFIFPRVRKSDPLTSFEAADNAKELAKKHGLQIVACLTRHGPQGKDGIAAHTGLDGNQVARRLKELETLGFIGLTGKTVKSKSNRQEREWRILGDIA
jgi:predicted transcriptional regulator